MPSQMVLDEKAAEVEEIKELLQGYKSIGIANLKKVRASQLQGLKKTLGDKVYLRVLKNTLMKLALENMGKTELKQLEEYLDGSNVYMFTDENPFKLALLLERGKGKTTAKHCCNGCCCSRWKHGATTRTCYQPVERCWLAYEN
jgi:ribosomal protein L10